MNTRMTAHVTNCLPYEHCFFSFLILFLICRKYNSLIQTQARELSHLRQRMREGQGVCHILTQHLGDTTKVQKTFCIHLIDMNLTQTPKPEDKLMLSTCSIITSFRLLRSCCGPMTLITTWVRASESSWHRTLPLHREWSPRSVDVRSLFPTFQKQKHTEGQFCIIVFMVTLIHSLFNISYFSCSLLGDRAESHDDKTGHELLALRWVHI